MNSSDLESSGPHRDFPPASPVTVTLGALLTLSGIVGVAVGISELGFVPQLWPASALKAVPIFILGALALLAGVELRAMRARTIVALALSVVARTVFLALAPFGWWSAGQSLLVIVALGYAWRLYRAGKLSRAAPDDSSKPTPFRADQPRRQPSWNEK
jgi:hypothetical protein